MALDITNANFENEVLQSDIPVIIDFWAPWCGPCKTIAPVIDEIENELGEKIKVGKVNVDNAPEIATKYSVMSIPTIMLFKEGRVMDTKIGALAKEDLMTVIQPYL